MLPMGMDQARGGSPSRPDNTFRSATPISSQAFSGIDNLLGPCSCWAGCGGGDVALFRWRTEKRGAVPSQPYPVLAGQYDHSGPHELIGQRYLASVADDFQGYT